MKPPRHAYFSADAAAQFGTSIYLNVDNEEVEVTCVGKDLIDDGYYKWPDRKSLKPVVRWLKDGRVGIRTPYHSGLDNHLRIGYY
jgi:hypothetical protein